MNRLRYEALHPEFGASVRGVDLGKPLAPDLVQEINAAIDRYSFVCFPDQSMDDDRQLALTRQFGNPEPSHTSVGKVEYFGTIGNVQKDGTVLGSAHKKTIFLTGNNMWHSDASFKPVPAFLSIMCAYETPAEGGTTMFVSLRAAYDRLPPGAPGRARSPDRDPRLRLFTLEGRPRCRIARAGGLAAACAPAARAHQSRDGSQEPVPRLPRPGDRGHERGRRPRPDRRADRSSDPA